MWAILDLAKSSNLGAPSRSGVGRKKREKTDVAANTRMVSIKMALLNLAKSWFYEFSESDFNAIMWGSEARL